MYYEYDSKKISDRIVKTAIIGCGGIANGKHLPNIQKLPNVQIVAFCDIILERAEKAAKEYGIEGALVCEDYREVLALEEVEAVHVLTPNISHASITIDALDAGKHVMCEKPMAMNYKEAQAMCDAAKRNNRLLTIGYQSRSSTNSQYLRKLVREGHLGEIYFIKCPAVRRRGVPGWGVFTDKEKQGGGPLIDIATHSIDNALFISGKYDVESVTGATYLKLAKEHADSNMWGLYDTETFSTEDFAVGFVKFKDGTTMIVEAAWMLNSTEEGRTLFCGTNAGAALSRTVTLNGDLYGALYKQEIETNPRNRAMFRDENLKPEEYEQKQWYSAILNGTELLTKPEEAAVVTKIIEAIYESAETGKTIYFD